MKSVFRTLSVLLWPVLPTADVAQTRDKIVILSFLASAFSLLAFVVQAPGGSHHFVVYAQYLLNGMTTTDMGQRELGFPLLILFSGYFLFGSILPLLVLNSLFAFLMPLMAYGVYSEENHWVGFYTAMAMVLSTIPYYYSKYLHHDHLYFFCFMATVYYVAIFVAKGEMKHYVFALIASLAALSARPLGFLLPFTVLSAALLMRERVAKVLVIFACIMACFTGAYLLHRHALIQKVGSFYGAQMFFIPYMASNIYGIEIDRKSVKAIDANWDKLRENAKSCLFQGEGGEVFKVDALSDAEIDATITRFLSVPTFDNFHNFYGLVQDDKLFGTIVAEVILSNPVRVLRAYLKVFLRFLFNPGVSYNPVMGAQGSEEFSFIPAGRTSWEPWGIATGMSESAKLEFTTSGYPDSSVMSVLKKYCKAIHDVYRSANLALLLLLAAGIAASYFVHRRLFIFLVFLATTCLAHAIAVAMTVHPLLRYHVPVMMSLIVGGGGSCIALGKLLRGNWRQMPLLSRFARRMGLP